VSTERKKEGGQLFELIHERKDWPPRKKKRKGDCLKGKKKNNRGRTPATQKTEVNSPYRGKKGKRGRQLKRKKQKKKKQTKKKGTSRKLQGRFGTAGKRNDIKEGRSWATLKRKLSSGKKGGSGVKVQIRKVSTEGVQGERRVTPRRSITIRPLGGVEKKEGPGPISYHNSYKNWKGKDFSCCEEGKLALLGQDLSRGREASLSGKKRGKK